MKGRIIASKYFLLAGFWLIFIDSIVFIKYYQRNNSELIATRLNYIQEQLSSVQKEIKKPADAVDLSALNQDFNKLATLMEQSKNKETTQLNQLISENRTELTHKLDVLHEMVSTLDKKNHPIKYLSITALPFKVISIDSIQQVSVATAVYQFKTMPLEKNDALAGWTVLSIDFGKQQMELENGDKEHVVVRMALEQGDANV